jgi:hypothetical protein
MLKYYGAIEQKAVALLLALSLFLAGQAAAKYSGGTGDPNDPYRIATAEDLNDIGNHQEDWNKHFILVNDVNLAEYTATEFKIIGNTIKPFNGVFDGNEHRVWNFTWSSDSRDNIALFGVVGFSGQVKNLGMENVDVNATNGWNTGSLVAGNAGTIKNCYSTGMVQGDRPVGGLVSDSSGTIQNCYSACTVFGNEYPGGLVGGGGGTIISSCSKGVVSGNRYVGGLFGYGWGSSIVNCYSTSTVSGDVEVGGLGGGLNNATVANCYFTGSISGRHDVGGLIGWNWGNINACYSSGTVKGAESVGGLVGYNSSSGGLIVNSFSISTVTGPSCAGGLVGLNTGTIRRCYSTGYVAGRFDAGGLIGKSMFSPLIEVSFWDMDTSGRSWSAGGIPKTTAEMKTKSTFTNAGWDFVDETTNGPNDVWRMCVEGVHYPLLSWQLVADFTCPDGIDIADLELFVNRWLSDECNEVDNFCSCADINYDQKVNLQDFSILSSHWLENTEH